MENVAKYTFRALVAIAILLFLLSSYTICFAGSDVGIGDVNSGPRITASSAQLR